MEREKIKVYIDNIINNKHSFGIKVFAVLNDKPNVELREVLITDKLLGFLMDMLKDNINANILSDDIILEDSKNISVQKVNTIYDIRIDDSYNPFSFIKNIDNCEKYNVDEAKSLSGFLFKINFNDNDFWAYQQVYAITKINRDRFIRIFSRENVFDVFTDKIVAIASRIDLIIIEDHIVTGNIKLLQNRFGFAQFIRVEARKTIDRIIENNMISNTEKLINLIGQEKTTTAKKLMKAKDSPVFKIDTEVLFKRIKEHDRYKSMIVFEKGKIKTDTQKDVDNFLKMLNDDLLKSELTQIEYDSEAKTILD